MNFTSYFSAKQKQLLLEVKRDGTKKGKNSRYFFNLEKKTC